MALSNALSLKLPLKPPLHPPPSNLHSFSLPPRFKSLQIHSSTLFRSRLPKPRTGLLVRRAVEESREEQTESEQLNESRTAAAEPSATPSEKGGQEQSDLGEEIRKAMMERKKAEEGGAGIGGDLFSGVAEEIREIEWPSFGKVLGTTGVVLGVIAGSSVVLLTVNALLAELSDKAFAGRGVQDFFS
ncbi:unnamed protein product [Linum tenue]|uniref:Preprotein translocase subunit SECE1 n=2 Tax=Linum tenue TaxID=586396 RepID=A0AAV0P734_9ROSI|nr:unnamed protein product [Linum tenue]